MILASIHKTNWLHLHLLIQLEQGEVVFTRDDNKKITGFKLNIDSDDFLFDDLDFDKTP